MVLFGLKAVVGSMGLLRREWVDAERIGRSSGAIRGSVLHLHAHKVLTLVEDAQGAKLTKADEPFNYLSISH